MSQETRGPPRIPGFAIERPLGQGGMGTVWLARDERSHQLVALKVLSAEAEPDLMARFDREGLIGRRLRHPDIVTFYDAGRSEEALWIAMEYLDGFELTRAMEDPAFGFDDRLAVMIRVALALGYAHEQGVIHRDVKPSNIFMTRDGGVRLLDFGIARTGDQRLTGTNRTMGTPRYMAPEQVLGTEVDGRADLFALALVAYELFAGVHPWEVGGRAPAMIYLAVLAGPAPSLRESFARDRFTVDEAKVTALAKVLDRTLSAQPEQRPATALELAQLLEGVRNDELRGSGSVPPAAVDQQAVAERRIEWARARAARLMMEGTLSSTAVVQRPAPELGDDRRAQRTWLALVVVFGVALAGLVAYAVRG